MRRIDVLILSALACVVALFHLVPRAKAAAPPTPRDTLGGAFEVEKHTDLAYRDDKDADPIKHKLDVYVPKGKKTFPVLFFVHGGTWKSGDKKIYGPLGELFARNGLGVVVTNYRLSPKVMHPAHIEDVAKAFAWVHGNIAKYGGRVDQLFACGHSAGGHLVALLATDATYLKAEKLKTDCIKGVLALSGVYAIAPRLFPTTFGNDLEVCRLASPLTHVNGQHAPFLILYADNDYPLLGSLAKQLHQALQKAKCEVELLEIKERDHITIIKKLAGDQDDPATLAMLKFVAKCCDLDLTSREAKK